MATKTATKTIKHLSNPNGSGTLCECAGTAVSDINFVTCPTCRNRHELIVEINMIGEAD